MKFNLNIVEFYITNTCNLKCSGCNRFNNLDLSGYEDWKKHKPSYKKFFDYVNINKKVAILGGEPLQHPDILTIIKDIRSFYPRPKTIQLVTNGLLLNKIKGLDKAIVEYDIALDVNVHNKKFRKIIYNNINNLFNEKKNVKLHWHWQKTRKDSGKIAKFTTSHNNVQHEFNLTEYFFQNSLNHPYELKPHESDPDLAWKACYSKCPTLAEGKFFKCPISHCMPTAVKQRNNITLTENQRALINTFPSISCDDIDQVSEKKWNTFVYEKIPQCSLCPQSYQHQKIMQEDVI